VTTISLLAAQVTTGTSSEPVATFDPRTRAERSAFVDVLRTLEDAGVVAFTAGDVEGYVASDKANAILTVDTGRLHRLLAGGVAAAAAEGVDRAVGVLTTEPRYGDEETRACDRELLLRWVRHGLARRLLDDPVLHHDELSDDERAYLASPSGRRWLRERAAEAGFVLEERAEGILAVDPDCVATDVRFPSAQGGTVTQAALLVTSYLVERDADGVRFVDRAMAGVVGHLAGHLRRNPRWAKAYQVPEGPAMLAAGVLDLLESLGLVRRNGPVVRPRPALARYVPGPLAPGPVQEEMPL
jgi:uncharacterized protein (TIGR02678 family)